MHSAPPITSTGCRWRLGRPPPRRPSLAKRVMRTYLARARLILTSMNDFAVSRTHGMPAPFVFRLTHLASIRELLPVEVLGFRHRGPFSRWVPSTGLQNSRIWPSGPTRKGVRYQSILLLPEAELVGPTSAIVHLGWAQSVSTD